MLIPFDLEDQRTGEITASAEMTRQDADQRNARLRAAGAPRRWLEHLHPFNALSWQPRD